MERRTDGELALKNKWLRTNITHHNADHISALFTIFWKLRIIDGAHHDYLINRVTTLGLMSQLTEMRNAVPGMDRSLDNLLETLQQSLEV